MEILIDCFQVVNISIKISGTDSSLIFLEKLQEANVKSSMDGRGRALDNIFTERLWRSVKYEEVYLKDYQTVQEAKESISNYLTFYNQERPQSRWPLSSKSTLANGSTACVNPRWNRLLASLRKC